MLLPKPPSPGLSAFHYLHIHRINVKVSYQINAADFKVAFEIFLRNIFNFKLLIWVTVRSHCLLHIFVNIILHEAHSVSCCISFRCGKFKIHHRHWHFLRPWSLISKTFNINFINFRSERPCSRAISAVGVLLAWLALEQRRV